MDANGGMASLRAQCRCGAQEHSGAVDHTVLLCLNRKKHVQFKSTTNKDIVVDNVIKIFCIM